MSSGWVYYLASCNISQPWKGLMSMPTYEQLSMLQEEAKQLEAETQSIRNDSPRHMIGHGASGSSSPVGRNRHPFSNHGSPRSPSGSSRRKGYWYWSWLHYCVISILLIMALPTAFPNTDVMMDEVTDKSAVHTGPFQHCAVVEAANSQIALYWVPAYPAAEAAWNSFPGWSELVACILWTVVGGLAVAMMRILWRGEDEGYLCLVTGKGNLCSQSIVQLLQSVHLSRKGSQIVVAFARTNLCNCTMHQTSSCGHVYVSTVMHSPEVLIKPRCPAAELSHHRVCTD